MCQLSTYMEHHMNINTLTNTKGYTSIFSYVTSYLQNIKAVLLISYNDMITHA